MEDHLYDRHENICHTYVVIMHFSLLPKAKCNLYVIEEKLSMQLTRESVEFQAVTSTDDKQFYLPLQ